MSKGLYTIIDSHVGQQDAILTQTKALKDRLKQLHMSNLKSGKYVDPSKVKPTLYDVMRTHMFYVKETYKPNVSFAYEYYKSLPESTSSKSLLRGTKTGMKFNLRGNNGDFIHDIVLHITIAPQSGNNLRYRYCALPGIRLIRNTAMVVDSYPIDDYSEIDMLHNYKTRISTAKRTGFEILMGQEQPKDGTYYNTDLQINQVMRFKDGAQTLKSTQPTLELWIPFIFDFCTSIERSLHTAVLSSQQVDIELELETLEKILIAVDSNNNPVDIDSAGIVKAEIYTKNIYFPKEINDLFSDRSNAGIVRVHKRHNRILTTSESKITLTDLKYPIESLSFGFRPNINDTASLNAFDDWHQMGSVSRTEFPIPAIINNSNTSPIQQLVVRTASFATCSPVVESVGMIIHGNRLYDFIPERFFNSYALYTYPDMTVVNDCGYYLISFAHYQKKFNTSGHVNNSTARELMLTYKGLSNLPVTLYVSAMCINLIVYSSGNIRLAYMT